MDTSHYYLNTGGVDYARITSRILTLPLEGKSCTLNNTYVVQFPNGKYPSVVTNSASDNMSMPIHKIVGYKQ